MMQQDTWRRLLPPVVLISSAVLGLEKYREAATKATLSAGMYPITMEHGMAASKDAREYSLDLANQAEIYVGIFAHRYGECPHELEESFSILEYRRADGRGIPTLIFIIDDRHPFPPIHMEADAIKRAKLAAFKAELRAKRVAGIFTSTANLEYQVFKALTALGQWPPEKFQIGGTAGPDVEPLTARTSLQLTTAERAELADLLFTPPARALLHVIDTATLQLSSPIKAALEAYLYGAHDDASQVIAACERLPGGLEKLVSTFRRLNALDLVRKESPDDTRLRQADELIGKFYAHSPLSKAQGDLILLASLLASLNVKQEVLLELYDASAPRDCAATGLWDRPPTRGRAEVIYTLIERLADACPSEPGQVSPLLAFVERAACRCDDKGSESLRKWSEEVAHKWGESVQTLIDFRHLLRDEHRRGFIGAGPETFLDPSLLVRLEPIAEYGSDAYVISAWLFTSAGATCLRSSEEIHNRESVQRILHDLLAELGRTRSVRVEDLAHLRIEFLVPHHLLWGDLEALPIDEGVKLGVTYPVVVRSLERIHDYRSWPFWESKWQYLMNGLGAASHRHVHWIRTPQDCDGAKTQSYLLEDGVVCLGFRCPPPRPRLDDNGHVLRMAAKAGTPVMLWPRHLPETKRESERARRLLTRLLSIESLPHLPDVVLQQRRLAARDGGNDHIGNWLTLVWEDPSRVPPDDVVLAVPLRG